MTAPAGLAALRASAQARARATDKIERLDTRLGDPQWARLLRRFAVEIDMEPLDERRAMLEAGAVEAMISDWPIESACGVARVLCRDVDPDLARELFGMVRAMEDGTRYAFQYAGDQADREEAARGVAGRLFLDGSPHRATLLAAHLVLVASNWTTRTQPAFLTPSGSAVVRLLGAWAAAAEGATS